MSNHLEEAQTINDAVFMAIGAASTCWESLEGTGVFDSTKAKELGEELIHLIKVPRLGYATTRELIMELNSRMETATEDQLPFIEYRTVSY